MQKVDDIDKKILDILIDNTRTPFTEIAKRVSFATKRWVFSWILSINPKVGKQRI